MPRPTLVKPPEYAAVGCQTALVLDVTAAATVCPNCSQPLVHVDPNVPWCPACEWNLGAYEPPKDTTIPQRFIRRARRDHRRAYALDARLFQRLALSEATRPGWTGARLTLLGVSVVLFVVPIWLLVIGAQLVLRPPWILGGFLIVVAAELRPRFPRIGKHLEAFTEADAPQTFALLQRVAAAMGAPTPATLFIDSNFNAFCGRSGIRRRPVLGLGLTLWGSLSPQGRVALLGHEFGHLVNGDPRQGMLTAPALTTFGRLADMFDPIGMRFTDRRGRDNSLVKLLGTLILAPLCWDCDRINLLLNGVGALDSRQAEYLADRISVRTGGSDGARELADTLLASNTVALMVRRAAATSADPRDWQAAAAAGRAEVRPSRRRREQRSIRRQAAVLASHPADGLRCRLIEQHPSVTAEVVISAEEWAASDQELAREYALTGRELQRR